MSKTHIKVVLDVFVVTDEPDIVDHVSDLLIETFDGLIEDDDCLGLQSFTITEAKVADSR